MPDAAISREAAWALVRSLLDAAGRRALSQLMDFYDADAIAVSPVFGEVHGRERIAATWQTLFSTLSDITIEVSDVLVDGDRIAVLSTVSTNAQAGWFGLPATGGPIGYRLVLLLTIGGGKIVRDERIYDSTGVVERLEKSRLDKELQTAAEVQRALMSRSAHISRWYESVGDSLPCRAIGGDFFEFMELPSGDVAIAMGDVAGKGPAAALLAAMLQGMLAAEVPSGSAPGDLLARLNQGLAARHLKTRFATLVYGVLSADGRLVYSSAGHNPPLLIARDGVRRLTAGGPFLGAFPDARFEEEVVSLRAGDTLVMFTDGVTEARDARDEEFGEERLTACLRSAPASAPIVLLNRIFTTVREFCQNTDQSDDITVTVTRRVL